MAIRLSWCFKVLLCCSTFLAFVIFWSWLSQAKDGATGQWFGVSSSSKTGIDFSSLFSEDLPKPKCQIGQVLLILVTSHHSHHSSRKAIRRSWAYQAEGSTHPWQVVFLVGRTVDVELDWRVYNEHAVHGDILMGNYMDTYRNLTLKVMHGMKWAAERCHPQYILKTDDDCFINTDYLPSLLGQHSPGTLLYVGSVFPEGKRVVIREPTSKWYVAERDYKRDLYPPYASGIGYMLSLDVAMVIIGLAEIVPAIPVEDAYIGILAERARVRPLSSARFAKHNVRWGICNYRFLMVIHGVAPEDQARAQDNVRRARTSCNHSIEITHWK
ncbi:beta-1,3-galactosyltransferase 5-like [Pseudophryne corroboree]|uniref:beta-1,3-galactosyltransferase 5-like n=1 Tax=Pseudophryne corroboree TaxID=495146 RepID=UPI0030815FAE